MGRSRVEGRKLRDKELRLRTWVRHNRYPQAATGGSLLSFVVREARGYYFGLLLIGRLGIFGDFDVKLEVLGHQVGDVRRGGFVQRNLRLDVYVCVCQFSRHVETRADIRDELLRTGQLAVVEDVFARGLCDLDELALGFEIL